MFTSFSCNLQVRAGWGPASKAANLSVPWAWLVYFVLRDIFPGTKHATLCFSPDMDVSLLSQRNLLGLCQGSTKTQTGLVPKLCSPCPKLTITEWQTRTQSWYNWYETNKFWSRSYFPKRLHSKSWTTIYFKPVSKGRAIIQIIKTNSNNAISRKGSLTMRLARAVSCCLIQQHRSSIRTSQDKCKQAFSFRLLKAPRKAKADFPLAPIQSAAAYQERAGCSPSQRIDTNKLFNLRTLLQDMASKTSAKIQQKQRISSNSKRLCKLQARKNYFDTQTEDPFLCATRDEGQAAML